VDALIIAAAVVGVAVYVAAAIGAGGAGFPLDDSWIHQVYGRSLALTGQWAFVPGVPSAASTSPLYTVLLAVGYGLRVPFYLWTYGLGAIGLAAAGLFAARLGRVLARQFMPTLRFAGVAAGLATVTAWHFVWVAAAGMETIIFTALTLVLITWICTRSATAPDRSAGPDALYGAGIGILGALVTVARPEGAGLFGLCLGAALLYGLTDSAKTVTERLRGGLLIGAAAAVAWIVCLSPYLALNLGLNRTLLPNTSAAKQAENAPLLAAPLLNRFADMLYPLIAGAQLIVLPGFIRALVTMIRPGQGGPAPAAQRLRPLILFAIPVIWPFVLILVYALRLPAPYQHGRYVIPALGPYLVFAAVGTLILLKDAAALGRGRRLRATLGRVMIRSVALTAGLAFAVFWISGAGIYAREVALINGEMVNAAQWIAAHVPPDELLAVHDIGAVGYFAPRPILDLAGLVSPEVVPVITEPAAVIRLMERRGVQWMMVSPYQLPMTADDPRLCQAYETPGADSPVHMSVYRIAWDGRCPAPAP
jgi:hypothetical protein